EVRRHIQFALAENASYTQDEPLLFRHPGIVDVEGSQEPIIVELHLLTAAFIFLNDINALLIIGTENCSFEIGNIHIQGFHGVEKILCHGLLLLDLKVLIDGVCSRSNDAEKQG